MCNEALGKISQCIISSCFIGDHFLPSQLFSIQLHQILAELYNALRRFFFSYVRPTNGGIVGERMESLKVVENLQRNRMSKPNPHILSHLCLVEVNSAFVGLDWDECMHIRFVEDIVPTSTLGSSLSVH